MSLYNELEVYAFRAEHSIVFTLKRHHKDITYKTNSNTGGKGQKMFYELQRRAKPLVAGSIQEGFMEEVPFADCVKSRNGSRRSKGVEEGKLIIRIANAYRTLLDARQC